ARIGAVTADIVPDLLPDLLENGGRAGEMNACEFPVSENDLACNRAVGINKIDDAVGKPCLAEYLHEHMCGIYLRIGRFPHYYVPHHGRRARKVAGNGGEIKRSKGEYESLQCALFAAVPHSPYRSGLLFVNLGHIIYVEAKEVDHF